MLEAPIDKLYDHLENLHSKPKPSSLSEFHLSVLNDKSALEQQKDDHNYLDDPISIDEVETTTKLLKSGKAPGPDRTRMKCSKLALLTYEMNFFVSLFERPFKIHKNGVFRFAISFFVLEILTFFYYAN